MVSKNLFVFFCWHDRAKNDKYGVIVYIPYSIARRPYSATVLKHIVKTRDERFLKLVNQKRLIKFKITSKPGSRQSEL